MQNTKPGKPELYCDPYSNGTPVFVSLQKKGVAHGACFLAVLTEKSDKIKNLLAIPFSTRKQLFNRSEFLDRYDIESGRSQPLRKLLDIFDTLDCGTIECPKAILRYYDKTEDSFIHRERVWAFWVNDFTADAPHITYMEHVAGDDRELNDDIINSILQKYRWKFDSLYRLQSSPIELVDFTKNYTYARQTPDSMTKYCRQMLYQPVVTTEEMILRQKHLTSVLGIPVQKHQVPIVYALHDIKYELGKYAVSPTYFWSMYISYVRCLYHAIPTYVNASAYGDVGTFIFNAMKNQDNLICDNLYSVSDCQGASIWLDTAVQIYCIGLAMHAFHPNNPTSSMFGFNPCRDIFVDSMDRPLAFYSSEILRYCKSVKDYKFLPFLDGDEPMQLSCTGCSVKIRHIGLS